MFSSTGDGETKHSAPGDPAECRAPGARDAGALGGGELLQLQSLRPRGLFAVPKIRPFRANQAGSPRVEEAGSGHRFLLANGALTGDRPLLRCAEPS